MGWNNKMEYTRVDYQVHTFLSHDGRATMLEHCARAMALGLDEIGFSEHKDFDPNDPVVEYFDYDLFMDEVTYVRDLFRGRLRIRAGVEIDYQQWFEPDVRVWLSQYPFDYVLGCVHYVDALMLMTDDYVQRFPTAGEAYRRYYEEVLHSVESGLIDIVGHLEYAKRRGVPRFGAFDPQPYRDQLFTLFDLMVEKGTVLEINTSGLRQDARDFYPCRQTLQWYYERGGQLITFGSDAHHPDELAHDLLDAVRMAWDIGFREVAVFERRKMSLLPLCKGKQ
jgi:histidinol-phosphatase (PHP family)